MTLNAAATNRAASDMATVRLAASWATDFAAIERHWRSPECRNFHPV
jgi:hypothetical protein